MNKKPSMRSVLSVVDKDSIDESSKYVFNIF